MTQRSRRALGRTAGVLESALCPGAVFERAGGVGDCIKDPQENMGCF